MGKQNQLEKTMSSGRTDRRWMKAKEEQEGEEEDLWPDSLETELQPQLNFAYFFEKYSAEASKDTPVSLRN